MSSEWLKPEPDVSPVVALLCATKEELFTVDGAAPWLCVASHGFNRAGAMTRLE